MAQIVLVTVLIVLSLISVCSQDISFTPGNSDNDATIPLSANYRRHLRKICSILEKKGQLTPEIESNKEKFEKLCRKLAADDQNISGASGTTIASFKPIMIFGVFAGASFLVWKYSHIITSLFRNLFGRQRPQVNYGNDRIAQQDGIRKARLEKLGGRSSADVEFANVVSTKSE